MSTVLIRVEVVREYAEAYIVAWNAKNEAAVEKRIDEMMMVGEQHV